MSRSKAGLPLNHIATTVNQQCTQNSLRRTQFLQNAWPRSLFVQHAHRRDRSKTNKTDLVFFFAFVPDNPNVSSKLSKRSGRFSKFCDQIMMVFVTIRFVMSSAKMVNDASKVSPVQKHFACKYSASSSTFSQYLSHFAICSLYTSLKRERPMTSPCSKTTRKHNFDPGFIWICTQRNLRSSVSLPHKRTVHFIIKAGLDQLV